MPDPAVCVVVAAWPDAAGVEECLEALAPQRDGATDVLVVSSAEAGDLARRFPWVRWVSAPAGRLIPHLWGLGIAAAGRDVVALTTANFTPAPDWVAVLRDGHARLASCGVGGAIDPPRGGGVVAWATYFLRYGAYLAYDREQPVGDLAADNAAYKRAALLAYPELLAEGFWEQAFHARVRASGRSLTFLPAMRVRLRTSFGFAAFLRQRLLHGRVFGQSRVRGRGAAWRVAAILGSPMIPAILMAKVALRVLRSRRDWAPFLVSLPVLAAFVLAWAVGEAAGFLAPGRTASGGLAAGA